MNRINLVDGVDISNSEMTGIKDSHKSCPLVHLPSPPSIHSAQEQRTIDFKSKLRTFFNDAIRKDFIVRARYVYIVRVRDHKTLWLTVLKKICSD